MAPTPKPGSILSASVRGRTVLLHDTVQHRCPCPVWIDNNLSELWNRYAETLPPGTLKSVFNRWGGDAFDVSGYAKTKLPEYTAESYVATLVYGDDAPPVATGWIRFLADPNQAERITPPDFD